MADQWSTMDTELAEAQCMRVVSDCQEDYIKVFVGDYVKSGTRLSLLVGSTSAAVPQRYWYSPCM